MNNSATRENARKKLIASLREKGYKLTAQRLEIISQLARDMTHPGAGDIFRKVRKRVPQISMSTVYYTLDMLKKEGLLRELEFYEQDNRYDITVADHINLICRKCGRIEDFPGELPYSYTQVQQKTDFQPVAMRYEYYGYCKDCRGKRAG
jgi:Fur family transcriptional regulator, peroxide stress response regulator